MKIGTYIQAILYLKKFIPDIRIKSAGHAGFERMKKLCKLLKNPQLSYPTIHVGGTSGKGSTSTFIASILGTKYRTGLYTSPHLERVNERIQINSKYQNPNSKQIPIRQPADKFQTTGREITDNEFVFQLNQIISVIEKMKQDRLGQPSYFEIMTAMAFMYFKQEKVDIAVIEVGMGGRYDATNVVRPEVAVITNIGLDHTEVLGKTVVKIATEKAGIIKHNSKVVCGAKQESVINTIKSEIRNQKSEISLLGRDFMYEIKKSSAKGSVFDYRGENRYKSLKISMLGEHQVENAVIALRVVELLNSLPRRQAGKFQIPNSDILKGLKDAYIPGRLEIVRKNPLIVLDGAHNPDKVKALVKSLKSLFQGKKMTLILAVKEDKDAKTMLRYLLPITHKAIFTEYKLYADQGAICSFKGKELLRIASSDLKTHAKQMIVVPDIGKAMKEAFFGTEDGDLILVTGSLYLIGEIKKNFKSLMTNSKSNPEIK